ncbi:MAG TPA: aminotransferase class III-fold pyridoxal phosphate-dependent enzyme [Longimicrobiales bacterium]
MSEVEPNAMERGRPPNVSRAEAERLAWELYGIAGSTTELPSERDQNFRVVTSAGDAFVLKLSQAGEDPALLDFQRRVFDRLAAAGLPYRFPRVVPTRTGEAMAEFRAADGAAHLVRLLEHVPGEPLATYRPHAPELLEGVGRMLGRLDGVLEGLDDDAAKRELKWDLRRGRAFVERGIDLLAEPERRALVERLAALYDARVEPLAAGLRTGVIHGDANDHNVLVGGDAADPRAPRRISGLIDFGDMVHSWLVAEPAIGAAYAMMGKVDPLGAAARVVGGYHRERALTEEELAALYPLIALRLCVSVVNAARERRRRPANAYLTVSEAGAWRTLERLAGVSPDFAHYVFRHACGLEPCPRTPAVVAWLGENRRRIAPVLGPELAAARRWTFDLSVGSLDLDGLDGRDDAQAWTNLLFGRMREARAGVGIGRYDEARRWYTADAFRVETDEGPEWRTVHLGVDLFVAPGTPVFAPLDGTVHALRDNAGRHDYGPTVILEHRTGAGVPFYTLYGHLTRDSLERLRPGAFIAAGEQIGAVGAPPENGNWAPHLHLQLVTDLLGHDGTFPGTARPGERGVWLSLSPDPNLLLGLPEGCTAPRPPDVAALLDARRRRIGPSLSIAYRRPLHIVRGWRQHLYDQDGRAYLDAVNNVAHVGHSHPRVVEALRRQAAVLNTNTRYLHEAMLRYAERLTATLPEPLRVCFFVCSGSEANELALRLARAHTGRRDVIVVDAAYHGNTTSLIDISPYKFDGPGGAGPPPWVHRVVLPDPYRGPYTGYGEETGRRYAAHVREAVDAARERGGPAAFFCESLPGCGGQIVLPDGYLAEAYRHVREAGGVCVADEVQVGFGRVGTHFWGFEVQGVVPDIVTLGKPIGNGHPLGAVVTTPEIAASFANGMEYFNTFGGNPVSCAVGLAVLDVIEAEGLQQNAHRVGARLLRGLRERAGRHALVGDVRGLGLYIGIELVLDRDTREPAGDHAAYVAERMRDHGILLSTDGPGHHVLKIKPPLVFTEHDADRLVETLDRVLEETPLRAGRADGA